MTKISSKISKKTIQKSVTQSSRLEGLNFNTAKNNKKVISLLKRYDRAFSL
ncbi:MAG: hypothetical protein ACD_72C00152G0005 [uncultured bacterium]|nr:MAG: hypothetical protein ACD_72C00152G0005 [uncultured bacterium]